MFEVDRIYRLRMMENGRDVICFGCRVVAIEMPVVKFDHAGVRELIVNVISPGFISAELVSH